MSKLTVFFEAEAGADLERAAQELQRRAAERPEVAAVSAQPMVTHGVGPHEIMMALQMAPAVIGSATAGVVALTAFLQALQKMADEVPALNKVMVQVGLKKKPLDQLTEADRKKLAAAG
jgi:hypothetical protein